MSLKLFRSRFDALRREIKILLIISLTSIVSIEFFLNKIPAEYQFQYDLGVLFLRLCYSYASAFVFYYLTTYTPKERKKVKILRYVSNKVFMINRLINEMLSNILRYGDNGLSYGSILTKEKAEELSIRVDPREMIVAGYKSITFPNHYSYILYQSKKIKSLISEIMILNDLLDEDILKQLTTVYDIITKLMEYDIYIPTNSNLDFFCHHFEELSYENNEMMKVFSKKYKKRYSQEHVNIERQRRKMNQL